VKNLLLRLKVLRTELDSVVRFHWLAPWVCYTGSAGLLYV